MDDSRIIDLFFERSEQAVAELERAHGGAVWKTASNILSSRQDVEECVNDTYLAVWNTVPPKRPIPLISYVCRIARNMSVNRAYANTAAKRNASYDLALDELEECIPSGFDLQSEFEARELTEAIDRFLAVLPPDDRKLFVRRYWYSCSVAELAAIEHSTQNRVSVRLFRLREKLRKSLMKEGLLV